MNDLHQPAPYICPLQQIEPCTGRNTHTIVPCISLLAAWEAFMSSPAAATGLLPGKLLVKSRLGRVVDLTIKYLQELTTAYGV